MLYNVLGILVGYTMDNDGVLCWLGRHPKIPQHAGSTVKRMTELAGDSLCQNSRYGDPVGNNLTVVRVLANNVYVRVRPVSSTALYILYYRPHWKQ